MPWRNRCLSLASSACLLFNLYVIATLSVTSEYSPEPWPSARHKLIASAFLIASDLAVLIGEPRGTYPFWPVAAAALNIAVSILMVAIAAPFIVVML